MKSILRYAGGKSRVANYLVGCFPKHQLYVDMFCGMLSVTLAKSPNMSDLEWINDKYNDIANFFAVIRSQPDEFIQTFSDKFVFDSEYLYRYWTQKLKEPYEIPSVWHAVMFWMTQKQTFSGRNALASTSYAFRAADRSSTGKHHADLPTGSIYELHERLRGVHVFNRDFRHIFEMLQKRVNNSTTFIFQDPPYWDTPGAYDYVVRFSWDDYVELAELNLATKCKWLLTINNHPDIRELYEGKEGIRIREYDILYSVRNDAERKMNREIMVSNYDTEVQFGPLFQSGG